MSGVTRLDLKTGFRCNNRCVFCVQGDKRERYGDKTTDELKALLQEARDQDGVDAVVFTGGEVTIRADLPELVAHARDLGFSVIQIQTNGRMLSSMAYLRRLADAGATEIAPAIHGASAAVHDELTRARGAFKQTVRGVRNARELGLPVLINSVITRRNFRTLPAMAQLFVALDVTQFQLAFVHPLGTAQDNFGDVVPRLGEIRPWVLQALSVGIASGIRCMTEAIPLCFLGQFAPYAAEWIIPRTRIVDATWVIDDYTELRWSEGKTHGPPCDACARNTECEGPWREYPAHFGWSEFHPLPHEVP